MDTKKGSKLGLVLIFLLSFFFIPSPNALAVTKDGQAHKEAAVAPGDDVHSSKPTSQLWRSFIWESLPAEWLRDPKKSTLPEAYQQNEWTPLFIDCHFTLTPAARTLLHRLEGLEADGIDAKPYQLATLKEKIQTLDRLSASLKAVDPNARDSMAEARESGAVDHGRRDGSASPRAQYAMNSPDVRPMGYLSSKEREEQFREIFRAASETDVRLANDLVQLAQDLDPYSKEKQVKALLGQIPTDEFLKEIEPPSYDAFRKFLKKYKDLASQFPHQEPVYSKTSLRPGDTGDAVRSLQKRLQQEGLYQGKVTGTFDAATQEAVRKFQHAQALDADGVVGQSTQAWLNVKFEKKAQMIAEGMKLMRQSETRRFDGGKFVRINIPQFLLEYHKDGKIEAVHRIIVGKAAGKKVKLRGRWMGENQTPVLVSTIEQVIFNPRWYVSDRIRKELSDEIAANPKYLELHGYMKMSSQYPWGEPRLFQMPGPTNPLGRVKFEFPNAYAVFLHDTPNKRLFQRTRRDFSHGCIRMENAREFAELLLTEEQNPSSQKTESLLETGRQAFIRLQQPIPIVIEYVPIAVDKSGQAVFCGDLYGWFDEDPKPSS